MISAFKGLSPAEKLIRTKADFFELGYAGTRFLQKLLPFIQGFRVKCPLECAAERARGKRIVSAAAHPVVMFL